MLSEMEGRAVLRDVFGDHGVAVTEDHPFHEEDVRLVVDGWCGAARVGYEFLSVGDRERKGFTPAVLRSLERWMEQDHLYLFLVDANEIGSAVELADAARSFLRLVASRRGRSSR